eukprot:Em0008g339a
MSEPMPYARDSSALAVALTRTKLSLPYSVEEACDLEQFSLAARREARRERCKRVQLPSNHKSQQSKVCMTSLALSNYIVGGMLPLFGNSGRFILIAKKLQGLMKQTLNEPCLE